MEAYLTCQEKQQTYSYDVLYAISFINYSQESHFDHIIWLTK